MEMGEKGALLDKMGRLLWRLQDPWLVVSFQKWFGVYRKTDQAQQCNQHGSTPNGRSTCSNGLLYSKTDTATKPICNGTFEQTVRRHRRVCSCEGGRHCSCQGRDKVWSENGQSSSENEVGSDKSEGDSESDYSDAHHHSVSEADDKGYRISNLFWYYLFTFGASLGYEMFYASFFPFWFWNIDSAVCRRVILVWVVTMYIGQALKEFIRLPRPAAPPVVRLEPGYSQEYGMPSTHAMVGIAVPFSFLIFTMHRYEEEFGDKIKLNEHLHTSGHISIAPNKELWDQPQYFFPTYENDTLLYQLDDDSPANEITESAEPIIPEYDSKTASSQLTLEEIRNLIET